MLFRSDIRNVGNMSYVFNGCSSLRTLDLSGFDIKEDTWMEKMFSGCKSLKLYVKDTISKNKISQSASFPGYPSTIIVK